MVRQRTAKNRGLPKRCRWVRNTIYYDVPKGQEKHWDGKKLFKLGKTVAEAYRVLAERIGCRENSRNIGELLDRYALEIIPTKAPKTAKDNMQQLKTVRAVFGGMALTDLEPQHVYKYYDMKEAKIAAKREIALLSHAFSMAVRWGMLRTHPFKGQVRLKGNKPRERYIEDWEIEECLMLEPKPGDTTEVIKAYITLRWLTGVRPGDLLKLRIEHIKQEGIYIKPKKTENTTGKHLCISWTSDLKNAVEVAKKARPVDISPYLFCNKRGLAYTDSGWKSIWQRFMKRVMTETKITERFTSHDIRAKTASDTNREHASKLLGHVDSSLTERVYRRKAEIVQPLK